MSQLMAGGGGRAVAGSEELVVRRLFETFARRDADAICAVCARDVEFIAVTGQRSRGGEPYRGHAGMRRYLRDAERLWEEVRPEPRHFDVRPGGVVVVTGRIYAWGEGRVVDQPVGWTFVVRDGLIARGRVHETAEDARAAAALLERLG